MKLAIPLVVAFATIGLGLWQAHLADLQHQNDIQLAKDTQEDATLRAYLDDMTTLLLDKKLGSQAVADKVASDKAAVVARAKTLTALRRLTDPQRKATVVQFLYEAKLIGFEEGVWDNKTKNFIYFQRTAIIDLSNAYLVGAHLDDAGLVGAHLDGAYLVGAYLVGAHLDVASLTYANLNGAHLDGALLHNANLNRALQLHLLPQQ